MSHGLSEEDSAIIDIHFGFFNKKLTDKLEQSANALKNADFKTVKKVQAELTDLKNEHLKRFNEPNYTWITFKNGAGIHAALDKKTFTMYDHEFEVSRALHPTDIKFENREVSVKSFHRRKCMAKLVILLVFGVGFILLGQYLIKRMQIIGFMRQPPLTNCENLHQIYDEDQLFSLAFQEFNTYKTNRQNKDITMNNAISRNGALFCFCEDEIINAKHDKFEVYEFKYTDNQGNVDTLSAPICKDYYFYMTGFGYVLEQSFNYLIVAASFVIRYIILLIVDKIRFFSLTEETKFAMTAVFWITFINYGIIYLLCSWDNRHSIHEAFDKLFSGLYPDFNALWFNDIGVLIIQIMISNMYWPPLEFIMFWGMRYLFRVID